MSVPARIAHKSENVVLARELERALSAEIRVLGVLREAAWRLEIDPRLLIGRRRAELIEQLSGLDLEDEESAITRETLRIKIEATDVFGQWIESGKQEFDATMKIGSDGKYHLTADIAPFRISDTLRSCN